MPPRYIFYCYPLYSESIIIFLKPGLPTSAVPVRRLRWPLGWGGIGNVRGLGLGWSGGWGCSLCRPDGDVSAAIELLLIPTSNAATSIFVSSPGVTCKYKGWLDCINTSVKLYSLPAAAVTPLPPPRHTTLKSVTLSALLSHIPLPRHTSSIRRHTSPNTQYTSLQTDVIFAVYTR